MRNDHYAEWLRALCVHYRYTASDIERLTAIIADRSITWPNVRTIIDQNRFGTRDIETVLAWLTGLAPLQVEVLAIAGHPFTTDRHEMLDGAPSTITPPRPERLTEAGAQELQAILDTGYMADAVYAWWCALGPYAPLGFTSGLSIAEAISHSTRGDFDGMRVLATLRNTSA